MTWLYYSLEQRFGFVHPRHRLLHSHSPYCECIADMTLTLIMVHRMFVARQRYLL